MILPMKAQEGALVTLDIFGIADNKRIIEPGTKYFLQEKIDGHRHMIKVKNNRIEGAWSSLGKDAMDKMTPAIRRECRRLDDGIYDGELYINGEGYTSTDVVRLDLRKKLRYVIFDYVRDVSASQYHNQIFRFRLLDQIFNECFPNGENKHVTLMPILGVAVYGDPYIRFPFIFFPHYDRDCREGTVADIFEDVLHRGGEGLILKEHHKCYDAGKRSYAWLKFKNKKQAQFHVKTVIFGSDDEIEDPYGRFHLFNDTHKLVIVRVPTQEWRERLLEGGGALIQKLLVTVKYQDETRDGALRHPIVTNVEIL